jgi:hypothetical protein
MIKEYRDIKPGEMSTVTVLAERSITNDYGRAKVWTLKHHTAGYECAGSCARLTDEKWSVTTMEDGSRYGNSFTSESEACIVFESDRPWYR